MLVRGFIGFEATFKLHSSPPMQLASLNYDVNEIIADRKLNGSKALAHHTKEFDLSVSTPLLH